MNQKIKIAFGMRLQSGAFGGGNQFGNSLYKFLINKNFIIVDNLKDKDIDIIFITETRKYLRSCIFDFIDVAKYLLKKPETLVIFRVNECDERKGRKIHLLNKLILQGIKLSDQVIFISNWLLKIILEKNKFYKSKSMVIYNGADNKIFNNQGYRRWDKHSPLKIVTHHWGAHWYKGFDIYLTLDKLIDKKYLNKIKFSYIGCLPKGIKFENTTNIPPKSGLELAKEIKKNHIYLTASINEPAGMHHIEGASCGLPLLYRNSGALPEYCQGYGIAFNNSQDFESKLIKINNEYDYFVAKIKNYNRDSEKMCNNYYNLILKLIKRKKDINIEKKLNRIYLYRYIFLTIILQKGLLLKQKVSYIFGR